MLTLTKAHFVDGDNMGMLQGRRGHRLGAEALHRLRRRVGPKQEQLKGNHPIQTLLARLIHHPHAPVRNLRQQLIITKRAEARQARDFGRSRRFACLKPHPVEAARTKALGSVGGNLRAATWTCAAL